MGIRLKNSANSANSFYFLKKIDGEK